MECFLSVDSNINISKQYKKHTYSSRNVWYGIDNTEDCIEYTSDSGDYDEITGWIIGNRDNHTVYYYADVVSSTMPYNISEWTLNSDNTTVTGLVNFDVDMLKKSIFLVTKSEKDNSNYTITDIFIDSNSTNTNFVKIYTTVGSISEGTNYLHVEQVELVGDNKYKYKYNWYLSNIKLESPDVNLLIGTSYTPDPTASDFKFTNINNNNYDIKYNGAYTNEIKSWSR